MTEHSTPSPTPPPAPPASGKKKMSPWAWILIGCLALVLFGGLLIVGGGVFAVKKAKDVVDEMREDPSSFAERMIELNPDLEVVDRDPDAGTMTIRNTETGEEATFDWNEIAEGRFSFGSGDQKVTIDAKGAESGSGIVTVTGGEDDTTMTFGQGDVSDIPGWLPVYPGTEPESNFAMTSGEETSGAVGMQTADSVKQVMEYYEKAMKDAGMTVQKSTFSGPDGDMGTLAGSQDDGKRTLNVTVTVDEGRTQIAAMYSEKP